VPIVVLFSLNRWAKNRNIEYWFFIFQYKLLFWRVDSKDSIFLVTRPMKMAHWKKYILNFRGSPDLIITKMNKYPRHERTWSQNVHRHEYDDWKLFITWYALLTHFQPFFITSKKFHQKEKENLKFENWKKSNFGGFFSSPKWGEKRLKLPDSYNWFSLCSQKHRRDDKRCVLYFWFIAQIWLNPPMDDHQPHWLARNKNPPPQK
jgi:hypothetical protein